MFVGKMRNAKIFSKPNFDIIEKVKKVCFINEKTAS